MDVVPLFSALTIRSVTLKNRIALSPMCMYSSKEGYANEWHKAHLGSRAVGGCALVMTEATAVAPNARISPQDLGIWSDDHIPDLKSITTFVHEQGAVAGIQLAHAGRKASTAAPWEGGKPLSVENGGWQLLAPSALAFSPEHTIPHQMTADDIQNAIDQFQVAAKRALDAGFKVVEIHAAHGYLIHEFLSPLTNQRTDKYGGSLENRQRFCCEVIQAVRHVWPEHLPLFLRISATDWCEGGWDIKQSIELAKNAKALGVDLIDVSSGAIIPNVAVPTEPGYQVGFAEAIREAAQCKTGAVGLITEPQQANDIVKGQQADMVLLGRQLLREPYWSFRAASELKFDVAWPNQYLRAKI